MEKEVWKDIIGYEGQYQVSNMGRVKSLKNGEEKILKQEITNNGYCRINLYKERKPKHYSVHRLVATAFIPNPNNYPQINHKNEQKTDNRIENLEWCTYQYNLNYGSRNEKAGKALKGRVFSQETKDKMGIAKKGVKQSQEHITNHSSSIHIPIVQYDLDNKLIGIYESTRQASEVLGVSGSNITMCLKGKTKTCGGFKWKYLQDFLIELEKKSELNYSLFLFFNSNNNANSNAVCCTLFLISLQLCVGTS